MYWAQNIFRMLKSSRIRWAGYVACMRDCYEVLVANLKIRYHFGTLTQVGG
jgi:hypothetical protein